MTAPRPTSGGARLARYGFADASRAATVAARLGLWDGAAQEPRGPLIGALGEAADPDLALHQLQRVVEAPHGAELLAASVADEPLRRRLVALLGASAALGDHLVAHPDDWRCLDGGGWPVDLRAAVAGRTGSAAVLDLRRAYRCALLALAAADLTGEAGTEDVMAGLATLADATLAAALEVARAEQPDAGARLAVIAMGKCGAGELNYVSDVDVIFVAEGDLTAASALASRLMAICGQVAWQVDAGLRPEGRHGPLVRTLASHAAYYRKWARTWEFQALLKARPAAGDPGLGRAWLDDLTPLVWQAGERPGVVEDVRAMRRRVEDHLPPGDADREIKLGRGGLRDVEFAVQLLQLVHGRADESLRVAGTLPALRALTAGGYVGRADGETLESAYRFLRTVEHRLQLQRLRRTHTVPSEPAARRWLAAALGYRPNPRRDAVEAFEEDWGRHAREVRRLHEKLLYRPLLDAVAKVPTSGLRLSPTQARARLEVLGFADPTGALRHIEALTGGVSRAAAIQRTLLPVMLSEWADAPEPDRGLLAYRQVSEKLGATPWYLRLLRDEGPVALRLARLLGLSRYATDLLTRDPEALRLLADDEELVPRPYRVIADGIRAAAARHDEPVAAVAAIRALRRRELLRIAFADLLGRLDVQGVGRALADLTDAVLDSTLTVARASTGAPAELRFAVIGMGRLGGAEPGYASDADVLFVYDTPAPGPAADAAAHAVAEELRRLLSVPAPDPPLGVDAGLRPEGRQGPLARSLAAYRQYYARWSRGWETQALLRARPVAGDPDLGTEFIALADGVRYPAGGISREHATEIRRIKARVDTERLPRGADRATHVKFGRGGLTDVEWTVQLLQLQHAHAVPGLRVTGTLAALDAAAGIIEPADAKALRAAWLLASRVRNAMMLVRGRPLDQLPRHGTELAGIVRALGRTGDPQEFLDEYLRTARRARHVVEKVFYA